LTWEGTSKQLKTESGLSLERKSIESALDYLKVPKTLLQIDDKYGTQTLLPVMRAAIKPDTKMNLLVDENDKVVSVVDPRSKFVQDNEFDEMRERVQAMGLSINNERQFGVYREVEFNPNIDEDITVFGDAFRKSFLLVRQPEGGVYFGINLVRLICTNGCTVQEASSRKVFRSGVVTDPVMKQMIADLSLVDMNKYLINSFSKDGELYLASVSDFMGMKRTLADITDKDVADQYFMEEPIVDFYNSKGVDIKKVSISDAQNLSSGLSYFDTLNILTHAVKEKKELNLSDKIQVGKWMSPRNAKRLFYRNFVKGQPKFNPDLISSLKGDSK
jgi:hypothetical protein